MNRVLPRLRRFPGAGAGGQHPGMIMPGGLLPSPHMRLLLTGASGFVGSTVLAHVLDNTDWHIVCPVTYRHHGDGARINAVLDTRPTQRHRVDVIPHDLALPEAPAHAQPRLLLQMATDQVRGPAAHGPRHHERGRIRPSDPHAGSKAPEEAIAYAYWRGLGLPLLVTNTMNRLAPPPHAAE